MLNVATVGGGSATVGVGAADEFDAGHDARTGGVDGFEEKPGDRAGLG